MARTPTAALARRHQMLRAARDVFVEKGFEAAGIRDVAARMGIGTAGLYHYIDSKQELLLEVMLDVQAPTRGALERAFEASGGVTDKLLALACAHVTNIARDPVGTTLLFTEVDALTPEQRRHVVERWNVYRSALQALILDGQADGSLRDDLDHRLIAMGMLGALNWTYRWYRPTGALAPGELGDRLGTLLLHGLLAPGRTVAPAAVPTVLRAVDPGALRVGRERELFDVATRLFRAHGFEGTTTAGIAEAIGVHPATLYHYMPGKEALLYAIVREAQESEALTTGRLLSLDVEPAACLKAILDAHADAVLHDIDRTTLVFSARRSLEPSHRAALQALDRELTGGLTRLVERGQSGDAFTPAVPAPIAVRGLLGALNWVYTWYDPAGGWDTALVGASLTDLILRGLLPRATA